MKNMNINKLFAALLLASLSLAACKKNKVGDTLIVDPEFGEIIVAEDIKSFKETASVDLGGESSAEISAYDPVSKRLFVVNNEGGAKIDVLDLAAYPAISKLKTIAFANNIGVNSVAVSNGLVAIALDGTDKQANGDVVVIKAANLEEVKKITVGAMPDMVIFTPDGKYILTANEGEPNDAYSADPVGSISVINAADNYSVKTTDFSSFENQSAALALQGFRIYGGPDDKKSTFAQDIEPEYITVSADSKKAFATLQENNGVAEIDIATGSITKIIPLGTKDISKAENAFDVSDKDNNIALATWPIKAYYLPDAISYFSVGATSYLALANEGDTRDYKGYKEEARVKDLKLDATKFPDAATLKKEDRLGRLTVTRSYGDIDGDGDFDEIYAPGARSVSFINASTGALVADIGKDLETRVIAANKYDDGRSDNKGVEVESVTVGKVNGKTLVFIGMERADMIAIYDIDDPKLPKFVQLFETGDAPEGLLYIKPQDSPNGRSLLVATSEGDGTVKFYQPDKL
jgi:DNA-binding beta-propeller fold protein YncE